MKMIKTASAFAAGAALLFMLAKCGSGAADAYRSVMNPFWVGTIGRVMGWVPCSVAELMILGAICLVAGWGGVLIFRLVRRRPVRDMVLRAVRFLALVAGVMLFLFEAGEGVYFSCTTFAERYGLLRGAYTTEELTAVCRDLSEACNKVADEVIRDENGYMVVDEDLKDRVRTAMAALGVDYPELGGFYPRPKGVLISRAMSYADLAGIYSIFTVEANYNRDMTDYNLPFTMCHELSHLKGVMPENEANFIGFLACIRSGDADLRYSGLLTAWIYCGNELYKRDHDTWTVLYDALDERVRADLADNTAFWNRYKGPVREASREINDSYLKALGLESGFESYSEVVDLIISWYVQQV